jgi:hypothetical protein
MAYEARIDTSCESVSLQPKKEVTSRNLADCEGSRKSVLSLSIAACRPVAAIFDDAQSTYRPVQVKVLAGPSFARPVTLQELSKVPIA